MNFPKASEACAAGTTASAALLLVDDDIPSLHILSDMLAPYADRRIATSGMDALRLCRERRPDVILLDIGMPEINGIELCEILKLDPALAMIPVIFVSAHQRPRVAVEAMRSGGSDMLVKPVSRENVLAVVQSALAQHWPEIPGIDPSSIREDLGDDGSKFLMLLGKLCAEYAPFAKAGVPADPDARARVPTLLHKLKGASATLGVKSVHRVVLDAEAAAAANNDRLLQAALNALFAALEDLASDVAQRRSSMRVPAGEPAPMRPDAETEAQVISTIIALARAHSVLARERFVAAEAVLTRSVGAASVTNVRSLLDDLDFTGAAVALDLAAHRPS